MSRPNQEVNPDDQFRLSNLPEDEAAYGKLDDINTHEQTINHDAVLTGKGYEKLGHRIPVWRDADHDFFTDDEDGDFSLTPI